MEISPQMDTPGRRLIGGAFAYWRAAELLYAFDPTSLAWATGFTNLGLAIELSLKGFIRERGGSEAQQRSLNHYIGRALTQAKDMGFQPSHPAIAEFVLELDPHYSDMSLRYLFGTSVELATMPNAIAIVHRLLMDVSAQVGGFAILPPPAI